MLVIIVNKDVKPEVYWSSSEVFYLFQEVFSVFLQQNLFSATEFQG